MSRPMTATTPRTVPRGRPDPVETATGRGGTHGSSRAGRGVSDRGGWGARAGRDNGTGADAAGLGPASTGTGTGRAISEPPGGGPTGGGGRGGRARAGDRALAGWPGMAEILRGLAALASLGALLVAVPVVLWAWRANPLPMAGRPYAGWDVVAAVSWLLWAWLVVCVGFEIAAQRARATDRDRIARPGGTSGAAGGSGRFEADAPGSRPSGTHRGRGGRPSGEAAPPGPAARAVDEARGTRRHAAPAPPFVRRGTARLVATAGVVVAALMSSRAALAATEQEQRPATIATAIASPDPNGLAGPDASGAAGDGQPAGLLPTAASHTVQRGESLWSIAEDGYPEAAPAQLPAAVDTVFATNRGAADPSGHRLADPNLINPGMRLALPALDAAGHAVPTTGGGAPPPGGAFAPGGGGGPASPGGAPTGETPRPSTQPPTASPGGAQPPPATPRPAPPASTLATPGTSPTTTPDAGPSSAAGPASPGRTTASGSPTGPGTPSPGTGTGPQTSGTGGTADGRAGGGGTAEHVEPSRGGAYDVPTWQAETWVTAAGLLGAAAVASVSSSRRRRREESVPDTISVAGPGGDLPDDGPISVEVLRPAGPPPPPPPPPPPLPLPLPPPPAARTNADAARRSKALRIALLLGEQHLRSGNPDAALAATQRGLAVHPFHPGLFALRMRAYAASGDHVSMTTEYGAYLFAEQANPSWTGETDRDLENLYWSLRHQLESSGTP
uniref:LysM domain-containing protein n=1 Tax=Pseudofrankia asymbiotica TaxID=1834516 RepID=A0A1V2I4N5_9ACTN